jgi:2-polyprenyl-3-methyl-5-hydroxy-6-metoxy-1,4-benzoquinol methylase
MQYEPIKHSIDRFISQNILLKKLFFRLLDFHLLRAWHIHRELYYFFRRYRRAEMNILDAGCGFGQYSYFILKKLRNAKLTGLDISEDHIEKAKYFFEKAGFENADFRTADLLHFTDPDKFDLIISVDVMEHILEDETVFRNFYTSLHPHGMLLISTPSDQGGSDVHSENEGSFIDEHVRNGYSVSEIRDKLLRAGFERIDARYTYGKSGQLSWRLSMKYPIMLLNFSKIFFVILPFYFILAYPVCMIMNFLDMTFKHSSGTGLLVKAWK